MKATCRILLEQLLAQYGHKIIIIGGILMKFWMLMRNWVGSLDHVRKCMSSAMLFLILTLKTWGLVATHSLGKGKMGIPVK